MELRHLKYFKTVAEELHFGKAAARLNLAQPPLSHQIRKLEEELGVSLFYRTKRHVELTKEGEVFLEKVYHLFKYLDESIEKVRMISQGKIGEIVIGFLASSAYDVLPTIIKHYRNQYPLIQVTLKQLTSSEQLEALQKRTIHIGIISEPIEEEAFNFETIRRESMVIALPKEHHLASRTSSINLNELANDAFIIIERKSNQHHYDGVINSCYEAGFSPNIVQETAEMSTVISLVSAGIGVAIVPASIQLLLQNEVIYKNIRNNGFHTETALVWDSNNQSAVVKTFVDVVRETVIPIFNK